MLANNNFFAAPDLDATIDRKPLIISPDLTLQQAIALMSQAKGSKCQLGILPLNKQDLTQNQVAFKPASCALVMEGQEIKGILTERDIVKLTAAGLDFQGVIVADVMTSSVVTLQEDSFKDIFAALFLFRRYRIRHLPLLDSQNKLLGVISPGTIRNAMRPANLLKLRRVADVMSKDIFSADLSDSVLDLAKMMAENRVSCVVVTETDHEEGIIFPKGIVTERDIMQFQSLQLDLGKTKAQDVMSSPLFLLSPGDSLLMAHQQMEQKRVRRLVVSWNWGRGLGIVTQTSLLKIFDPIEMHNVIESLQNTVSQLEQENSLLKAKLQVDKLIDQD